MAENNDKKQPNAPASETEALMERMAGTTAEEQLVSGDPTPAVETQTLTKSKVPDPPEATVEAHQEPTPEEAEYQEDPNTRQETIAWEYKGNGVAWLEGIPARDLTNGEYRQLAAEDKARIRKSDLYQKPPQVEKHVRDTARKGTPPKTSKEVAATKEEILDDDAPEGDIVLTPSSKLLNKITGPTKDDAPAKDKAK